MHQMLYHSPLKRLYRFFLSHKRIINETYRETFDEVIKTDENE